MKYLITYEVQSEGENRSGQFEFEAEQEPTLTDETLLAAARENSVRFHQSGLASLSITSISLIS